MQATIVKPLGAGLLALLIAGGVTGCYYAAPYRPVPVAPPPGHVWYPYDYYYYPSSRVYFQISTGYYWYHDHDHWYRTRHLPPHVVILPRDRVHLRVDKGEPWHYNREHVDRYRPRVPPTQWHDGYNSRDFRDRNRVEREHNSREYRDYGGRRDSGTPGAPGGQGDRRPGR